MLLRLTRVLLLVVLAVSAAIFVSRGVWTHATGHKVGWALLVPVAACTYLIDRVSAAIRDRGHDRPEVRFAHDTSDEPQAMSPAGDAAV